jgi:lipopolysaccharide transport system ATP-binding protein
MKNAIVVDGVSKKFKLYHPDRPWTLQEAVQRGLRRMRPLERFWALRNISFNVPAGCTFGVIGANGSGKSTLLRLIGRVMQPDGGTVKVDGRIGALLDLGAGFHHDLTGRENVFVGGVVGGLTRSEVAERFDSIVAFAELENFIDNPLRTYSTGMQMRLAFAVAAHVDPEILLIDEVLSVGDISFQRKCLERLSRFKAGGCSIVLVSHDVSLIRDLCDEALWLRKGEMIAHGPTERVVESYVADMQEETRRRTPEAKAPLRASSGVELIVNKNRFGSLELEITAVRLLDQWNATVTEFDSGSSLRVEIDYLAPKPIPAPIFQVHIFREDGLVCYDLSREPERLSFPTVHGKGQIALILERVDLNSGLYYVDVGAYVQDWSYAYDYHSNAYPLIIHGDGASAVLQTPYRWEVFSEQTA